VRIIQSCCVGTIVSETLQTGLFRPLPSVTTVAMSEWERQKSIQQKLLLGQSKHPHSTFRFFQSETDHRLDPPGFYHI
jgi:hypothetical protein